MCSECGFIFTGDPFDEEHIVTASEVVLDVFLQKSEKEPGADRTVSAGDNRAEED
jgi:hypothetical protein